MDNSRWIKFWRISATATLTNKNFLAWKLPPPDLVVFRDYSQELPQSQGGLAQQGYINCRLLWDRLDYLQGKTLRGVVDAAITAGALYATVDRSDGSGLLNDFVDLHGIAHPLTLDPPAKSRGVVYENVELFINNVTIDADPSAIL